MTDYSANIPPTFNAPVPAHWISKVEQITFDNNVLCQNRQELDEIKRIAAAIGLRLVAAPRYPGVPCFIYLSKVIDCLVSVQGEGDEGMTPAHYFISQNPLP